MVNLYEEVASKLNAHRGRWPELGRMANVSHSWICKIAKKKIPDPGYRRLSRLMTAMEEKSFCQ